MLPYSTSSLSNTLTRKVNRLDYIPMITSTDTVVFFFFIFPFLFLTTNDSIMFPGLITDNTSFHKFVNFFLNTTFMDFPTCYM